MARSSRLRLILRTSWCGCSHRLGRGKACVSDPLVIVREVTERIGSSPDASSGGGIRECLREAPGSGCAPLPHEPRPPTDVREHEREDKRRFLLCRPLAGRSGACPLNHLSPSMKGPGRRGSVDPVSHDSVLSGIREQRHQSHRTRDMHHAYAGGRSFRLGVAGRQVSSAQRSRTLP